VPVEVLGWYNRGNAGDEFFRGSLRSLLGRDLSFVSEVGVVTQPCILGGGDVIKPAYLSQVSDGRPVYLIGVGVSYESEVDLLREVNVAGVIARSAEDQADFVRNGVDAVLAPDLAWLQFPTVSQMCMNAREDLDPSEVCFLFADDISASSFLTDARELSHWEAYKWRMAEVMDHMRLFANPATLPLSSSHGHYDQRTALDVASRMRNFWDCRNVEYVADLDELLVALSGFKAIVSMKLHGLILGILAGTPVVNIGASQKTHRLMRSVGLAEYSVDPLAVSPDGFREIVVRAVEEQSPGRLLDIGREQHNSWMRAIADERASWLGDLRTLVAASSPR